MIPSQQPSAQEEPSVAPISPPSSPPSGSPSGSRRIWQFLAWLQQPTTLSGLSIFMAGVIGLWTGALSEDIGYTVLTAALPLLLPDNTTARRITQAGIIPLTQILAHHHMASFPTDSQKPESREEEGPATAPPKPERPSTPRK